VTRETLENLIVETTGRRDKLTLIRSAIDMATEEVSKERLWLDLQTEAEVTTVVDQGYVELVAQSTRVAEVRLIDDLSSRTLLIRPKTWLVVQCPSPESRASGRPVYGYLEGTRLNFLPVPDDAYVIRYTYFKLHPALSAASSELLISHAGPSVVAFATHWVFQSLEKYEDANQWYLKYQQLLKSAKKVDTDNSAVRREMTGRGDSGVGPTEFWNDPFVRENPLG